MYQSKLRVLAKGKYFEKYSFLKNNGFREKESKIDTVSLKSDLKITPKGSEKKSQIDSSKSNEAVGNDSAIEFRK